MIGTNLLTKKNATPPGSHFHEDRTVNVASRVLTLFYYNSHIRNKGQNCHKTSQPARQPASQPARIRQSNNQFFPSENLVKNAPPLGSQLFQANIIIFEFIEDIIETNLLTKFHEDWTINVASRVLTRKNALPLFHEDQIINVASRVLTRKNSPPPGGHVFQPTGIICEIVQDIIEKNLLTKFHEDWTINVDSRVLTRFYYSHIRKNAPPHGSHVFQAKVTIFELIQDNIGTNLLTKFHEDRKINVASRVLTRKNAPPPGGHVFQPTSIIFKLVQDIIGINLLNKFHEDQTINVASRTNLLTKFHEDWTINVASRELTRQMLTPHNTRRTKGDHKSSP
ncbi:hypothetical protein DPMN_083609 [Dreissena polymorpha]|uniref:Uncharacterized protein n=1 Tax=Dreissena polymorpha TaxID=45954 RepID=A0A9D3YC97_DREPO|nr:hypothetical protein DPMN_083609 [Dreissena polymorpha]